MSGLGNKAVFAKNLVYYVGRSGRDQKEIAEILGVAPSTFNEWVKGKKYPRIDKIEMLANFFGILKSDLIEDKNEPPVEQALTEGERALLDLYRKVPLNKRQMVLQMIRIALETQ